MTKGVAIKALKRRNTGHTTYFHPKKSSTCSIKKKSRDKNKQVPARRGDDKESRTGRQSRTSRNQISEIYLD